MSAPDPLLPQAVCYARAVTRHHARTFYFASGFLPRPMRHAIRALYAYTRTLDDLVDESPSPALAARQLRAIDRGLAGRIAAPGSNLLDVGLADAVARYRIPVFYFHSLAAGLRMDFGDVRYARWKDLYRYCWRVAGAVGLMVSRTFGRTEPGVFKQVIACGIAMQLTNILRDVGEDLDRGRIYLPLEDLDRFGVTEAMLRDRRPTEPVRRLIAFEIARARHYYARGAPVLGSVRGRVRMTAELAMGLYGRILDRIEANDYDVFTRRASVSLPGKLGAVPRVLLTAWLPRGSRDQRGSKERTLGAWPSS